MLRIVLYKGCKLNNKYEEVFSFGKLPNHNDNILDEYLETLVHSTAIDIDSAYYENEGELIFENLIDDRNIYCYNYMKILYIEDETIIWKRYCFVSKIEIKHDLCYVSYKEDIWSSYIDKAIGFNNSLLINSRVRDYASWSLPIAKLPLDYDGNNPLKIDYLNQVDDYIAIIEIQVYQKVSGTTLVERPRKTLYCLLADYNLVNNYYRITNIRFLYRDIIDKLTDLANYIPTAYAFYTDKKGETTDAYDSYTIGNIYLLPGYFDITFQSNFNASGVEINKFPNGQPVNILYFLPELNGSNCAIISENILYTKVIQDDYKMISVGTFNSQIQLIHNKTNHNLIISLLYTDSQLSILLNMDNQVKDVTADFEFEVPFETISSEQYSARRNNTILKSISILFSTYLNAEKVIGGMEKTIAGAAGAVTGGLSENSGGMIRGMEKVGRGTAETREGYVGIAKNLIELGLVNAAIYSNGKGTFNIAPNIRNQKDGLLSFSIIPDNEEIVKIARNKYGYYTCMRFERIDDLLLDVPYYYSSHNINYNVIKFAESNIYGDFPNEIAEKINEILNKGVRIWFTSIPEEDNYDI